ncbi:MAG: hypothetical protein RL538_129 [Candidatus Parcubacteria bacterium]
MICGEPTLTCLGITRQLRKEGLTPGTPEFRDAVSQRFVPTGTQDDKGRELYIENPDYEPGKASEHA